MESRSGVGAALDHHQGRTAGQPVDFPQPRHGAGSGRWVKSEKIRAQTRGGVPAAFVGRRVVVLAHVLVLLGAVLGRGLALPWAGCSDVTVRSSSAVTSAERSGSPMVSMRASVCAASRATVCAP